MFKKKSWFYKDNLGPGGDKYSPAEILGTITLIAAVAALFIALLV